MRTIGRNNGGRATIAAGVAGVILSGTGCVQDALADGLYGGVTDTIAAIVSGLLLGLFGLT